MQPTQPQCAGARWHPAIDAGVQPLRPGWTGPAPLPGTSHPRGTGSKPAGSPGNSGLNCAVPAKLPGEAQAPRLPTPDLPPRPDRTRLPGERGSVGRATTPTRHSEAQKPGFRPRSSPIPPSPGCPWPGFSSDRATRARLPDRVGAVEGSRRTSLDAPKLEPVPEAARRRLFLGRLLRTRP